MPEHNVRTAGKFESKIECCDNGLCAIRHKVVTLPHNRPQRDWITIAVAVSGLDGTKLPNGFQPGASRSDSCSAFARAFSGSMS